jgi:tetratricopeptide (TPR) repeat protein
MTDPAPSAPIVLHPAAAGDGPAAPGERGATQAEVGRVRLYLSKLARLWRRLPSIEDARKFVVNVAMIAAAALALVVIGKTALRPATVIDAIGVPKELEERGYTSAVVAQRLIDEIIRIGAAAASLNDRAAFSSLPFENKIPKIDVPVAGMSLATFVAQLRELVGIVDTRIGGEVTLERSPDAAGKEGRAPAPMLSLRLRITDKGTVHVGEPAGRLDALLQPAALQLVERFDPYIAASYYYVTDDFDNAQRMVQRLLDSGKAHDRRLGINLRGLIALAQQRYQEALAVFTDLVEAEPRAIGPRLNRSAALLAMGMAEPTREGAQPQFEGALADALAALALTAPDAKTERQKREIALAQTAAGEALWRMNDPAKFDEALDRFQRAVAADRKYARAYYLEAQIHRARNERAEAAALLAHAVDVDPNDPDIYDTYTTWGEVLKDMGRLRDAQAVFERVIALDPKKATGYAAVGKIYLEQRNWTKAADYLHKAIDADPSWPRFHYYFARALVGEGKLDPARAAFERAATLDPSDAAVYAGWGQALAEAARQQKGAAGATLRAEAAAKLAKAGEIAPRDSELLKEIGKAYVALDQPARALEAYTAAAAIDGGDDATRAEIARLRQTAR